MMVNDFPLEQFFVLLFISVIEVKFFFIDFSFPFFRVILVP